MRPVIPLAALAMTFALAAMTFPITVPVAAAMTAIAAVPAVAFTRA